MDKKDVCTIDLQFAANEKPLEEHKKISLRKSAVHYFREYCNSTSIHGFRYFGEKRTIFEKIWWFIIFGVCLGLCVLYIILVYKKWDRSPVIVTFATTPERIYNIPFPAVTICAESKIKVSVFNYSDVLIKTRSGEVLTEREKTLFGDLSFLCDYRDDLNYSSFNYSSNIFNTLEEVNDNFSIINCKYLAHKRSCEELFTPIITDEGLCYTFNMLDRNELFRKDVVHYANYHNIGKSAPDWSIESGYGEKATLRSYPKRAQFAGARNGLKFDLKISDENPDIACRSYIQGYRLLFHTPMRHPRPSQQYIRVPLDRSFTAVIKPSQITTSEAVKSYATQKRKCYFPSERKLEYFQVYSQLNCKLDCLTKFTLRVCGCVLFFMPRKNDTRICDAMDYECAQIAESYLRSASLQRDMYLNKVKKLFLFNLISCDCLPMCSDIDYSVSTSQTNWNWTKELETSLFTVNESEKNFHLSRVTVYFVSSSFIGSERNELYGTTDFIANFGGLLGLFTGFSVLSLMEIIYFLSVRLICNVRLFGYWAGPAN